MNKLLPLTDNNKNGLRSGHHMTGIRKSIYHVMYIYNYLLMSECKLQTRVRQVIPWEFFNIQPNARVEIKIERNEFRTPRNDALCTFQYFSTGVC